MKKLLSSITDFVSTKKGMWLTILIWLVAMIALSAGPRLSDYKGTPGIYVFTTSKGTISVEDVSTILKEIKDEMLDSSKMLSR